MKLNLLLFGILLIIGIGFAAPVFQINGQQTGQWTAKIYTNSTNVILLSGSPQVCAVSEYFSSAYPPNNSRVQVISSDPSCVYGLEVYIDGNTANQHVEDKHTISVTTYEQNGNTYIASGCKSAFYFNSDRMGRPWHVYSWSYYYTFKCSPFSNALRPGFMSLRTTVSKPQTLSEALQGLVTPSSTIDTWIEVRPATEKPKPPQFE